MFDNIGRKIKNLAIVLCFIDIISCIIFGVSLIIQSSRSNPTAFTGWIILILGPFVAWVCSFTLYGFGELIEKTSANNDALYKMEKELIAIKSKLYAEEEQARLDEQKRLEEQKRKEEERKRAEDRRRREEEYKRREEECKRREEEARLEEERKCKEAQEHQNTLVYPHTLKHYNGICPNCGLKHYNDRNSCVRCGAKFASTEP